MDDYVSTLKIAVVNARLVNFLFWKGETSEHTLRRPE